jgi:hypothetical protein
MSASTTKKKYSRETKGTKKSKSSSESKAMESKEDICDADVEELEYKGEGYEGKVYTYGAEGDKVLKVSKLLPFEIPKFQEAIKLSLHNRELDRLKITDGLAPINYYYKCNVDDPKRIVHRIIMPYYPLSFADWYKVRKGNTEAFNNMLFQVAYNLAVMHYHLKYIHNDIHFDNIMFSICDKSTEKYFKYIVGSKTYYLRNMGFRVVLIDFGKIYKYRSRYNISDDTHFMFGNKSPKYHYFVLENYIMKNFSLENIKERLHTISEGRNTIQNATQVINRKNKRYHYQKWKYDRLLQNELCKMISKESELKMYKLFDLKLNKSNIIAYPDATRRLLEFIKIRSMTTLDIMDILYVAPEEEPKVKDIIKTYSLDV